MYRALAAAVPIPWPEGMCITQLPEMRAAFTEITRRAYAAAVDADTIPPEYLQQQRELDALMTLMNSEFARLLKFYALKHAGTRIVYFAMSKFTIVRLMTLTMHPDIGRVAGNVMGPTEELEAAKLTQLTFEGFSLELRTLDLADTFDSHLKRSVVSTSVLFDRRCMCPDDVEEQLIAMFQ